MLLPETLKGQYPNWRGALIPREWSDQDSQEGKLLLYGILGMLIGSSYVVVIYLVSHSPSLTLLSFGVVALPLAVGRTAYLQYKARRIKKNKDEKFSRRFFVAYFIVTGFAIYTLPFLFLVLVFLSL